MNLFYTTEIEENTAFLSEEESKHCIKILRMQKGEALNIIDGKGGFYNGVIQNPHPKRCEIKILEHIKEYGKRNYGVHIAISPTKNVDRIEFFVEKAVEFGVDEISFIRCEHSERKEIKTERIERIVMAAAKQSIKAYLPVLHEMIPFKDFIKKNKEVENKFIAYLSKEENKHLLRVAAKSASNLILIGPEGDFSPEEIRIAIEDKFTPVSLGESRLRTETAGIAACHILNLANV